MWNGPLPPWHGSHVAVIGDYGTDRWVYGTVHRMSPESPVPVLLYEHEHSSPGMAGLVAKMVDALGGISHLMSNGGAIRKTRFMARVPGRSYQPMLRLDHETTTPISDRAADELLTGLRKAIAGGCRSILVSDYRKGTVTPYLMNNVRSIAKQQSIPVAVDPGRTADWELYRGCVVKSNSVEWSESGFSDPHECVQFLELPALIVTHGDHGITMHDASGVHDFPVTPEVGVDVCGAGDQAFALLGCCLSGGTGLQQTCRMMNEASRLQVMRAGCVPVTFEELRGQNDHRGHHD